MTIREDFIINDMLEILLVAAAGTIFVVGMFLLYVQWSSVSYHNTAVYDRVMSIDTSSAQTSYKIPL